MNKWLELLLGLVFIIGAILLAAVSGGVLFGGAPWAWNFWSAAGIVFLGGLFWFVVGIGILFILLGISDLKG